MKRQAQLAPIVLGEPEIERKIIINALKSNFKNSKNISKKFKRIYNSRFGSGDIWVIKTIIIQNVISVLIVAIVFFLPFF